VLLQHVEDVHGSSIELDGDYFWSVPPSALFDAYNHPNELTVGQLSECLENLGSIAAEPERATSYALVWLADVLRAAGYTLVG
jgi:hypothetical protein